MLNICIFNNVPETQKLINYDNVLWTHYQLHCHFMKYLNAGDIFLRGDTRSLSDSVMKFEVRFITSPNMKIHLKMYQIIICRTEIERFFD